MIIKFSDEVRTIRLEGSISNSTWNIVGWPISASLWNIRTIELKSMIVYVK